MGNDDIDSLALKVAVPKARMKPSGMRTWLKQYKVSSRSSTVTNAFVAALLPHDKYDVGEVEKAMIALEQDPTSLCCVYCDDEATRWDHLTCLVKGGKANGFGHRIHNLVPCCALCNSSKGGVPFDLWILGYEHPKNKRKIPGTIRLKEGTDRRALVKKLRNYQNSCPAKSEGDLVLEASLMALRDSVFEILKQADKLVEEARGRHESSINAKLTHAKAKKSKSR